MGGKRFFGLVLVASVGAFSSPHIVSSAPYDILFDRGDANVDGGVDLADAIFILFSLFGSDAELSCKDAADANDDGLLDISDAVWLLSYLFLSGDPPAEPFGNCGDDPTPDALTCEAFALCEFDSLIASYSTLRTVAGTGSIREGGFNAWSEAFEGALATEVELSRPHMTMSDSEGNLYVADKDAHAIRKITEEGVITTIAGTNSLGDGSDEPGPGTERSLNAPNGLWARPDGTVYVLDLGNSKVRRFSPDGILTTLFQDPTPMFIGRGLWVADDETLVYFSSATLVKRWSPSAGVSIYAQGFSQLGNLVVAPDGSLVVTDRGASQVYRIPSAGEVIPIAGNGESAGGGEGFPALESAFFGVRGVWFHPLGGYFLATHEGSQLWYVDSLGTTHLFLAGNNDHSHSGDGEHFRTPGSKISEPRAVTMDALGNIILTENDFGYVRMVERVATEGSNQ